ncbi:BlaI/MecI/CopY family transcriptional regulator [Propionibacteriaceae bacterium Y1923]|uniref:BlaI/MecI/CopY family transcriptional regulator n=1 Tax=Aestuariimicrobium sp. Y1814 TaxID=3418742 RepID=UPI003C2A0126
MLGELEAAIMQVLWSSNEPMSVRAVYEQLAEQRKLAYTTVMTVLDRLAKKGRVTRTQEGRAWIYSPSATHSTMVVEAMSELLDEAGDEANLVLAQFVEGLPHAQHEHLGRVLRSLHQPTS